PVPQADAVAAAAKRKVDANALLKWTLMTALDIMFGKGLAYLGHREEAAFPVLYLLKPMLLSKSRVSDHHQLTVSSKFSAVTPPLRLTAMSIHGSFSESMYAR